MLVTVAGLMIGCLDHRVSAPHFVFRSQGDMEKQRGALTAGASCQLSLERRPVVSEALQVHQASFSHVGSTGATGPCCTAMEWGRLRGPSLAVRAGREPGRPPLRHRLTLAIWRARQVPQCACWAGS